MIRKLQENDIDIVMKVWLDTNIQAHNFIDKSYWENNFDYVRKTLLKSEVYVYLDNNLVQGFIGLTDNHIEGIFVKDNMQSKGIGKLLLDYVKNIKDSLTLCVYQKNVRALEFYQREDFKIQSQSIDTTTTELEFMMFFGKF